MAEETNVGVEGSNGGAVPLEVSQDAQTGQNETQKTYTQEEYEKALKSETDKKVKEALGAAKAKWESEYNSKLQAEKDEAKKLATMSADERAKAEFEKKVKAFEEKEARYNAEKLTFECTKQLASENLPVEMAETLTGKDAETTKANIEAFKTAYNKAIQDEVDKRLKGRTPRTPTAGQSGSWIDSVRRGAGLK